jgi:ubiquinone/menaquinone biosynthesis C-methylase UbiE
MLRTQEIMLRYLPLPPAMVLDVGGGPGAYACWLAELAYEVHLIDAVPLHVEMAKEASQARPEHPIASISVGDARGLDRRDASVDAVVMLGPLYHFTDPSDRLAALSEARRVLRDGGLLFAAAISRFASILDGLRHGFLEDPEFVKIVERDLADGQHRNPTDNPAYFTSSFFHHPDDLRREVEAAGLRHEGTFAVEGVGWMLRDLGDRLEDANRREQLLYALRRLEAEPSAVGITAHLLAVARR